ncbi:hypothetical protein [uncultured Enterococcus sp.]|uniref:hypothetical protein n=1 Tax=uncultured Enterococcus sp. TaxID=167972 RepID=UPI0026299B58|nr:hypothetical protein [uncultured Enterococcus sp.]
MLDKIKATEMKNEELMQALRQKVNDYELELQHKYETLQNQNKAELKAFVDQTEERKQADLDQKAAELAAEVQTTKQHLKTSYQEKAQNAVAQVIEKVMITYGSH